MSSKLNLDGMGSASQTITQDDLDGDVAVLTVIRAEQTTVSDKSRQGGERTALILGFEETGDLVLWPNRREAATIASFYGDDLDEWKGKAIPVEKVKRTYNDETFHKVAVMEGAEWPEYVKGLKAPKPEAAKSAPAKVKGIKRAVKKGGK